MDREEGKLFETKVGHWPLVILLLFLSGCLERTLESGLDSKQSIEILDRLYRQGIQAEREEESSGRNKLYRVLVQDSDYGNAVRVLSTWGLPRGPQKSFEELIEQKGFVPGSKEMSALRLDYALSVQVEDLLKLFPGVVDAKALVRSKTENENSSVSVALQYYSPSGKLLFDEREIKEVVAQAVPSLSADRVKLTTTRVFIPDGNGSLGNSEARRLAPFSFRVLNEDSRTARIQLLILALSIAICGVILGHLGGRALRSKHTRRKTLNAPKKQGLLGG